MNEAALEVSRDDVASGDGVCSQSDEHALIRFAKIGSSGVRRVELPQGRSFESAVALSESGRTYGASEYERDWLRSSTAPPANVGGRKVRIGDAFCGGGIFSLGVDEALRAIGACPEHVFGLDFNADAIEAFRENFPESYSLHADITQVVTGSFGGRQTGEERSFLKALGGGVDILVAGPPCQGHSDLNNHTRREDPKNSLYFSIARMAELLKPEFVLIENVPGVVHDKGSVVDRTAKALEKLGYYISSRLVDLKSLGVPQKRKRFILVASKKAPVDLASAVAVSGSDPRSIAWAINDLREAYCDGDIYNSSSKHSSENCRRIDYLFEHDLYELPNRERPPCHRDKAHSYTSVYGRMRWDDPAPTITGGFGSTGQGRFVHPLFRRTLTPHEACRLQFVPDFYRFPSGIGRRSMQQIIGNAAPPKLSQTIILGAAMQGVLL